MLDEFHTYDGAQGTDVAMLLRRLGLALKSHWAADDPRLTDDDRARPLGRITPVATSATLGDKGDPRAMLEFAETVFGEPFDEDVGGHRVTAEPGRVGRRRRSARGRTRAARRCRTPDVDVDAINEAVAALGDDPAGEDVARTVFGQLYDGPVARSPAPTLVCCSIWPRPTRWCSRWPRVAADAVRPSTTCSIGSDSSASTTSATERRPGASCWRT